MKKSLAVTSASVLGMGLATMAAAPAHAADVTTPCTDVLEHLSTLGTLNDNWFADCVPQYGAGKVEFTLTADEPFPAEFLPLTDAAVTSTYSGDADAAALYWGATPTPLPKGFVGVDDSAHPTYWGMLMLPIAGVQSVDPATLPAACAPDVTSYSNAYRVDYEPVTVTFTQTINGEEWEFRLNYAPAPVFSGLNFVGSSLDSDAPQCLVLNDGNLFALNDEDSPDEFLRIVLSGTILLSPFATDLDGTPYDLGEVARYNAPGLANTGAEISPLIIGAGAVALLGGAGLLVASRIRRNRRSDNA